MDEGEGELRTEYQDDITAIEMNEAMKRLTKCNAINVDDLATYLFKMEDDSRVGISLLNAMDKC